MQHALRALSVLRSAEVSYDAAGMQRFLEGMLSVGAEDYLTRNANGDVIGVKDQALLSPAERARLKKLEARVRRSVGGKRSHIVSINVELVPALDIVKELARMGGWYADADGPSFAVNIAALGETRVSVPPALDPLLAELADAVLSDGELRRFVGAKDPEKVELLRTGIDRLRGLAA